MDACDFCGLSYTKNAHNQKYCSERCQINSRYKTFTCIICKNEFSSKHPNRRFCSNKCQHTGRIPVKQTTLKCTQCGTSFNRNSSRVKDVVVGHFCSNACRKKGLALKGKESHRWNSKQVKCTVCGEEILRQMNEIKSRKNNFCSHVCYGHWLSENRIGEDSPSWRGLPEQYKGSNWPKLAAEIRLRDGNRCQICGDIPFHVNLDVHHKIPSRFFESKERANRKSNLISLCKKCHAGQKSHWWTEVPDDYKQYM